MLIDLSVAISACTLLSVIGLFAIWFWHAHLKKRNEDEVDLVRNLETGNHETSATSEASPSSRNRERHRDPPPDGEMQVKYVVPAKTQGEERENSNAEKSEKGEAKSEGLHVYRSTSNGLQELDLDYLRSNKPSSKKNSSASEEGAVGGARRKQRAVDPIDQVDGAGKR